MADCFITRVSAIDKRYSLPPGAGSDAVHSNPEYSLAVTRLETGGPLAGTGITLTLGRGNRLVCDAIEILARPLIGREIEALMAEFGRVLRQLADDPAMRWLGPHKGVVHLALASITNACFDLWAKSRGVPLWKLLLDLSPDELVALLDLSYVEDVLTPEQAREIFAERWAGRTERESILKQGYPGYDTSVGWMAYEDQKVCELTKAALAKGFTAFKLKVGSPDHGRDLRRAQLLRECAGDRATLMFDANQQWNLFAATEMGRELAALRPLWIEEPTHPDDVLGHVKLTRELAPVKLAAGEHMPNRVVFKNFIEAGAIHFVQADAVRLAGISEFLTVSLLATRFGLPLVPHVGDMGQLHQHLVLFNRVALGQEIHFLEHIPHLRQHFLFPVEVEGGVYRTPQEPGASTDLVDLRPSA
ncbi:mandelate racemase [Silvibacterium dinghuense]|uniref:Mandelate racemase n=2 Tax=Silvibacterium dinghuense TaxID=1560006 RepID=A0A4Q1SFS6_9BACT|nr:mandelate racemase [Silvibacterium dinghuense]GGH08852.1 L-fuconate dehydratase [Silvibacterium dinghuense]